MIFDIVSLLEEYYEEKANVYQEDSALVIYNAEVGQYDYYRVKDGKWEFTMTSVNNIYEEK